MPEQTSAIQGEQTVNADSTEDLLDILSADETAEATPTDAQAGENQTPSSGTSAEDSKGASQPPPEAGQKTDGDEKTTSDDEVAKTIEESLGLPTKEPETMESLKVQLAASSREGMENARKVKGLEEALSAQGLKPVVTTDPATGKPTMKFVASEEYVSQKIDESKLGERTLTKAEEQEAMDDPEGLVQKVWNEAVRKGIEIATKSPVPTISANDVEIPPELIKLHIEEVKHEAKANGQPVRPEYTRFEPYIDRVIETQPEALRNLMKRDADVLKAVHDMAYGKVAHVAAPIMARAMDAAEQAAKRQENAKGDVSLASGGGVEGAPPGPTAQGAIDEAEEIVNAAPLY